jgi:hypothetical protein
MQAGQVQAISWISHLSAQLRRPAFSLSAAYRSPRSAKDSGGDCAATMKWSSTRTLDQRQHLLEFSGQQFVGAGRLGDAGRVIVRQHHRCRIVPQCLLDHLAGIDAGLRQRATKQLFGGNQAILRVEPQGEKHLVLQAGEVQPQVVADTRRVRRR